MKLQKGQRDKLEKYVNLEQPIEVVLQTKGNAIYDTSCFGLDESGKLAGDEYMIFYNQTSSPQGEITYHADAATATFRVQLLKIPQKVQKLSFTISIDGQGSKLPVYVLFISDGGIHSEREIKKAMKTASKYPVFWQFIGVGGSNYGILERLDEMSGRYVDNASFFALDDFKRVSNEELYDRMLEEFPQWLKIVKQKKMI